MKFWMNYQDAILSWLPPESSESDEHRIISLISGPAAGYRWHMLYKIDHDHVMIVKWWYHRWVIMHAISNWNSSSWGLSLSQASDRRLTRVSLEILDLRMCARPHAAAHAYEPLAILTMFRLINYASLAVSKMQTGLKEVVCHHACGQ